MTDKQERFFVDVRGGCVAVRDREHPDYDADYRGLHFDMPDVMAYWHGKPKNKRCETCGHERFVGWVLPDGCEDAADELCRKLNSGEVTVEEAKQ